MRRPELTIKQILAWADAYHERTGRWPGSKDGLVWEAVDEKWSNIDHALRQGLRGLHRGQSLAKLLDKHRNKRNRKQLPRYTLRQILAWADAHHTRTGQWPSSRSGAIAGTRGETWWAVDMALRHGQRGLAAGSSLAQLLSAKRRVPNRLARPRLFVRQILRWADHYHQRTGNWPNALAGQVAEADGDTWLGIDQALKHGHRGLRRGSSLAQLLARHRGVGRHERRTPLSPSAILNWADAHFSRTGTWPRESSGPIPESPGETWQRVHIALFCGRRSLPGGETLAPFVATRRRLRTKITLPKLTERQILVWAKAFHRRRGCWPKRNDGPIPNSQGETWSAVDNALKVGRRGLTGKSSLSKLLRHRSAIPTRKLVRPKHDLPSPR